MLKMNGQFDEEDIRRRRAKRREEMRRQKQRQALFRKLFPIGLAAVFVLVMTAVFAGRSGKENKLGDYSAADNQAETDNRTAADDQAETDNRTAADDQAKTDEHTAADNYAASDKGELRFPIAAEAGRAAGLLNERSYDLKKERESEAEKKIFQYTAAEDTLRLGDDIFSSHVIFVDTAEEKILACKDEKSRVVPASMTKVLTLLVALENIDDLDDEFVITTEITDYCLLHDCSVAGYAAGEKVTVRDLLYGAILPSGGDGALGLAFYVTGSQEAFVELMNEKLAELGLSETAHFTNCIGIYNENHYCTVYDMAVIMEAAMQNEICREVLSTRIYTTSRTEQHPEGIELSNWFLRRIEDKDTGGMTMYGKTGYVDQSGSCAVSCGIDKEGKKYICVTTNAINRWRCIEDHAYLYKYFSAS